MVAYLVSQGESSHLWVILESFNADRTGSTSDLQARNDAVALLGVRRRQLALAAGTLLQLVHQGREGNLLDGCVHVAHTVETGRENALEIQNTDLSLKLGDLVDQALGRAENETGQDIFLLETAETKTDLVTTLRNANFLFRLGVDCRNINLVVVWHHDQGHSLLDDTSLNLALNHGTHVAVFGGNGHHEWGVELALHGGHVVEVLQQGRSLVEGADVLGNSLLDTHELLRRNGHKEYIRLQVEARCLEELSQLSGTLLVPLSRPVDSRVVHLVDNHDQLVDTLSLGEHGVLTGLAPLLETGLVLTLTGGDDENTNISLSRTTNHVGDIGLVAGRIENRVTALLGLEETSSYLDSLTLGTLLLGQIQSPGQIPSLTTEFLGLSLVLVQSSLVHHAGGVENGTTEGRLASINVADEDDVDVLLSVHFLQRGLVDVGRLLVRDSVSISLFSSCLGSSAGAGSARAARRGWRGSSAGSLGSLSGLLDSLGSGRLSSSIGGFGRLLLLLGLLLWGSRNADGKDLGGTLLGDRGLCGVGADAQDLCAPGLLDCRLRSSRGGGGIGVWALGNGRSGLLLLLLLLLLLPRSLVLLELLLAILRVLLA